MLEYIEQLAAQLPKETDNYRDLRMQAYPSIQDQLDMIYHDSVNGTRTWVDSIRVVKEKYPKVAA